MAADFPTVTGNAIVDQIIQYILDDTNRPDKMDVIKRRIQRAITRYHRIDFWKKDLIEQTYNFEAKQAIQVIDTNKLIRFRAISYVRKFQTTDINGNQVQDPITGKVGTLQGGDIFLRAPERMFDGYGFDVQDSMYLSGTDIKINCTESIMQVYMGYYSDPLITPIENINSWIASEYPNLIAADVKQKIFNDIGKDAEAKSAIQELQMELSSLQTNNIRLTVM